MAAGKCPKCEQLVVAVHGHGGTVKIGLKNWEVVTLQCPNPDCRAVLGCQIDPTALKSEIAAEVVKAVTSLLRRR
jgi:hypothetical protein